MATSFDMVEEQSGLRAWQAPREPQRPGAGAERAICTCQHVPAPPQFASSPCVARVRIAAHSTASRATAMPSGVYRGGRAFAYGAAGRAVATETALQANVCGGRPA